MFVIFVVPFPFGLHYFSVFCNCLWRVCFCLRCLCVVFLSSSLSCSLLLFCRCSFLLLCQSVPRLLFLMFQISLCQSFSCSWFLLLFLLLLRPCVWFICLGISFFSGLQCLLLFCCRGRGHIFCGHACGNFVFAGFVAFVGLCVLVRVSSYQFSSSFLLPLVVVLMYLSVSTFFVFAVLPVF